ncbi:protein translocase subunit SecA [Planotetraspora thailandica]|uniref:Protein translocase subunit SecA n=2 Tax=Planotetraspora thailandica TaxID=487172 RepID=A0A8J3XTW9_9ACTN|nr:protein translocase subunit SecA [Planotetraspora thailandica]
MRADRRMLDAVRGFEAAMEARSDEELRRLTELFRRRVAEGEPLDTLLPEAFATVREAARRESDVDVTDAHLRGAAALHRGLIAEMHPAEEPMTAMVPAAYLNALTGEPVHVLTRDEFTARRHATRLGGVLERLGLETGVLIGDMTREARRAAYVADVVFGVTFRFCSDYLSDNLVMAEDERVQRGLGFAVVDEAGALMIDDVQTTTVVSEIGDAPSPWIKTFAWVAAGLRRDVDYQVVEKESRVTVSEAGIKRAESLLGIDDLYNPNYGLLVRFLESSLEAKELYHAGEHYVVHDGAVVKLDQKSGTLDLTFHFGDGLHRAIEAKEGLPVSQDRQTGAEITRWAYFRLYDKLAGLTGSVSTDRDLYRLLYRLDVTVIPPQVPLLRVDQADLFCRSDEVKWRGIADLVAERHLRGQPVLVDVTSDENADMLGAMLEARQVAYRSTAGLTPEEEAEILAGVGARAAVTIVVNAPYRATHIRLGDAASTAEDRDELIELGGLLVIGSERRLLRRDDELLAQLAGNPGEPGETRFFMAPKDPLLVKEKMPPSGLMPDEPMYGAPLSRASLKIQKNYAALLGEKYKEMLSQYEIDEAHRAEVYRWRNQVLSGEDLDAEIRGHLTAVLDRYVSRFLQGVSPWAWQLDELRTALRNLLGRRVVLPEASGDVTSQRDILTAAVRQAGERALAARMDEVGAEDWPRMRRTVLVGAIDLHWRRFLSEQRDLLEAVNLETIHGGDPLARYRKDSVDRFTAMTRLIEEKAIEELFAAEVESSQ